jgi:hypothetical protein
MSHRLTVSIFTVGIMLKHLMDVEDHVASESQTVESQSIPHIGFISGITRIRSHQVDANLCISAFRSQLWTNPLPWVLYPWSWSFLAILAGWSKRIRHVESMMYSFIKMDMSNNCTHTRWVTHSFMLIYGGNHARRPRAGFGRIRRWMRDKC